MDSKKPKGAFFKVFRGLSAHGITTLAGASKRVDYAGSSFFEAKPVTHIGFCYFTIQDLNQAIENGTVYLNCGTYLPTNTFAELGREYTIKLVCQEFAKNGYTVTCPSKDEPRTDAETDAEDEVPDTRPCVHLTAPDIYDLRTLRSAIEQKQKKIVNLRNEVGAIKCEIETLWKGYGAP